MQGYAKPDDAVRNRAIKGPLNPFGSVHVEELETVFQGDAVYGINTKLQVAKTGRTVSGAGSGVTSSVNQMFKCATGTTANSYASIESRRRMRYRAGQGVVGRFAGYFTTGVASSIQIMGFGTSESGFYFGYNGTSFGILHVTQGTRELHTLTISTASTATNDYNVTLPSGDVVNVTATNNNDLGHTAHEISRGTFPGWTAVADGDTVLFLSDASVATGGTFSLAQSGAGTPAAGSDATTTAGVAATKTWIAQSSWNRDKLDGTTETDFTLDPTKGNVFEIGVQYLGFGTVSFYIESVDSAGAIEKTLVHVIENPNTLTRTHVSNPNFPFNMRAESEGSTSDIAVYCGSYGGFNEGRIRHIGPRHIVRRDTSGYVGTTWKPIFTIRNKLVFNGVTNQNVVNVMSRSYCHDDATPISFMLVREVELGGPVNFASWGVTSIMDYDEDADVAASYSDLNIVDSLELPQNAGGDYIIGDAEVELQPGEALTLIAKTVTGTATYVNASLAVREDQ